MADTSLLIEPRGGVLLLKLNDPTDYPRLRGNVLREIEAAIRKMNSEGDWRGAVICGTGKCFAAGADLEEIKMLGGVSAREFAELGQRGMLAIENSKKPVIAAIRGYCFGGGFDLALACRVRIASEDAVFGHRGAALGIMTGWGGTQRLPRVLGLRGKNLALELMATGRAMDANEAAACGLISEIAPATTIERIAIRLALAAAPGALLK